MTNKFYPFRNKIILAVLIAFLFSCSAKKAEVKQNPNLPGPILPISVAYNPLEENEVEKWKNILHMFYDTILSHKLNGQVLIAKNGVILFEAYNGFERLHGGTSNPMNANTSIHLASVSKTFTAGAILLLQQTGKLEIEDPVTKYLPDFPYPDLTLKLLLNHRSGLPNYVHLIEDWGWKTDSMVSNWELLQLMILNKAALVFKPDTKFSYCNTNYAMLALIIEKVSGLSYGQFLYNKIFYPLQMLDTYVFTPKDKETANPSYDWKNGLIPFNNLDAVYGDKNIYSTVRDLYKWDQALYTNSLLTEASKKLAYTPYSNEKPGIKNYGLGWRMFNFPNNKNLIFHNGWWHGNNNAFIRLIEDSATIICLGNKYSRSNYSVMQLSYLFGDYPFEYEIEEKDTAKTNELLLLNNIKLKADSIKIAQKKQFIKDSIRLNKDSLRTKKDSLRYLKPKDMKKLKDTQQLSETPTVKLLNP